MVWIVENYKGWTMGSNICIKIRKARKLRALQNQLDTLSKPVADDSITRISVHWVEEKLDGFIIFLNQDKKRLLNMEKSKFEYLQYLVDKSTNPKN